jgi:hypothetical protein
MPMEINLDGDVMNFFEIDISRTTTVLTLKYKLSKEKMRDIIKPNRILLQKMENQGTENWF